MTNTATVTHAGYSIEPWANGTWSIYRIGNSMYDCRDGFTSIEAAKAWIDANR